MIDVNALIESTPPKGNYFAPDVYLQGDNEFGLLENRSGARLIALPDTLLKGLFTALDSELGIGAGVALTACGKTWGTAFYKRFADELAEYYGKPIQQMEMVQFLQTFKQCWKSHGYGLVDIDLKYYQNGFIVADVVNSAFIACAPQGKRPMGFLEAGILMAFFSQLTGEDLHCEQTTCESLGADKNTFILGLKDRLKPVSAWLTEGHDHATIMELLCRQQG
ncbi:MAG: V4R domain-containing protein [Synechocystis sp.]|nr:V4R domain-containing protein [Synechocystis sp.]